MTDRLVFICEEMKLFPNVQYGFRPNFSTVDGLRKLVSYIQTGWNNKNSVSLIALDLCGAYNNVQHDLLISKMKQFNIPVYITQWLTSFLSNRCVYFAHSSHVNNNNNNKLTFTTVLRVRNVLDR